MSEPGSPRPVLRLDTGVHDLARLIGEEIKEGVKDALKTADVAHTTEAKLASDSMRAALSTEARAHARKVGTWVAFVVTSFLAAGGGALWTFGGPEQAVQKAEHAAEKVELKADDLEAERAKVEALRMEIEAGEQERELERRAVVDDRIEGVEVRIGGVEGKLAGTDSKIDALLDVSMDQREARKVKARASATAKAVEAAAANEP